MWKKLYHWRWNGLAGRLYDGSSNLGNRFIGGLYNQCNGLYNRSKLLTGWLCSDISMLNSSCGREIHQPSNTDTIYSSTVNLSNSWSSRQIHSHGRERINGQNIHEQSNENAKDASLVNLSDGQM
ncbi:hypothetical protein TorRG33x02_180840 [Trema orientale]|uniref:Uncharacterized protein n=1 Tax=Trema orientale TaxID=63057 RepID=A0A2P5EKJ0_TREOI|nr:hypothetical protein TorRG33x02_180840 [Trema orientale]